MATYQIDPLHSEIVFKVKHLMISTVTGNFNSFDASMQTDADDFENAAISFSAQANSISTNNEQRDGHLKSADFFDAEKYPEIKFVSTSFKKKNDEQYILVGNLTIKDQTHSVELAAEYGGTMTDFYGQTKVGFEVSGKISRSQFGLTWSAVTEAGGIVVSDEIKLQLAVQFIKQA
ncbi:MAG: YceI family protein [Chitinophagaceae bacterium]